MRIYTCFALIFFLISCKKEEHKISLKAINKEKSVSEIISELNKSDTILHLDLSHKKLDSLPDLSKFLIKSLDLSYNNLDTIPLNYLPKSLEKLDASYNKLKDFRLLNYKHMDSTLIEFKQIHNTEIDLKEINLSHNQLKIVTIAIWPELKSKKWSALKKIDISFNNLGNTGFTGLKLNYLDVSNNPEIKSEVLYSTKIDTLLQENNLECLQTNTIPPPPPIPCY